MTWSWNKLSAAKWEDAWSERIAGNPNAVITKIKGGKTVRITVYCDDEEDALALKKYFGGTVREIKTQDWVATQKREKRPPLKIRDALVITEQSSPENLAALRKQFPSRCILSVPAEMAFGTGDHATTSTCQIPQKNIMEHDGHRLRNRRVGYGGAEAGGGARHGFRF